MTDMVEQSPLAVAVAWRTSAATNFKTAGALAKFLKRYGIRGCRRDPCNCPVATFLRQEFGLQEVSVCDPRRGRPNAIVLEGHEFTAPRVLWDLAALVDRGYYQDLLVKGSRNKPLPSIEPADPFACEGKHVTGQPLPEALQAKLSARK